MGNFTQNIIFEVIECPACAMQFGITETQERRLRDNHQSFYCPQGHPMSYGSKSKSEHEAARLKKELQQANNRADQHRQEACEQRQRATSISKSYQRVRERVRNGVCPCCNRTFENLARHMATKHEDYGTNQQLRTVRLAYGLTQVQLAKEVGVSAPYISLYERGMELPRSSENRLNEWLAEQSA